MIPCTLCDICNQKHGKA